jgi:hypothetical protein
MACELFYITICEGFNKQLGVFMMQQIDMFYHFVLDLGHRHVIDWDNELLHELAKHKGLQLCD